MDGSPVARQGPVLCAGHVNWDVTLRVDRLPSADGEARIEAQRQSSGGSAANVAVVLAGLETDPALLGSVGTDEHGLLARHELEASGVETHLVDVGGQTTVKYLVVDGEGEVFVLGNEGVNEAFEATDLPADRLDSVSHLHLTSQSPETAARLASDASDAGVVVSFDPGRRITDRNYGEVLRQTDILFCNEREAEAVAADGLLAAVTRVVVKHGAGGAEVRADGDVIEHPGFAVDPVDSAGAGDAFAGGFLAARVRGDDVRSALAVGNACGALAARTTGARLRVDWRDVRALLDIGGSA